jgi:transcriptional regulator with XRE-family HTH domain
MINIDSFINRIDTILDYYSLSASAFADALGVQRSGLSHLMSGRNKPSLDLVMKISETYPEVNLYWLLNGTGSFPAKENTSAPLTPTPAPTEKKVPEDSLHSHEPDLFSAPDFTNKENTTEQAPILESTINYSKGIERIVIFYKDGTFKNYNPGQ